MFAKVFGLASGIERLVERFPAATTPDGPCHDHQTVMVGSVQYKKCTTVCLATDGLYLHVSSAMASHPALLIPWAEVRQAKETRFFLQPATELTIGEPKVATVTLLGDLAAAVRPFLPAAG